jgi:TM2 domain-containing membrane protein YozV/RNA polymerase subunit RPABC4/transcription elongation factor Spt4
MLFIRMSEEKTKYCPYCGVQIDRKYNVCPNCGKPQPPIDGVVPTRAAQRKNPLIAGLLSLLITGAGQIYLGKIGRGLIYLGFVLLISIALDGVVTFDEMMILGVIVSIISAVDAYLMAKAMNRS